MHACHFRKNNRLAQRLKASTSQPVNTGSVLDHIFAQLPPASLDIPYEDESEKVLQLHCNFFGSHQRDSSTPGRQPVDTGREPAGVNRQDRPYVTMSQVDRMMQIFHTQKEYFPFVIIAENTTAETLRQKWPFLLLSVLVVASAADPVLQKLLDEQFRKVLATRVVMQGEKSLDYVQGLLVYLAWHPINLRPINNQMWQYMQLAIAMVSDLNLESTIESTLDPPEDQMIARNIILGCYFLSSRYSRLLWHDRVSFTEHHTGLFARVETNRRQPANPRQYKYLSLTKPKLRYSSCGSSPELGYTLLPWERQNHHCTVNEQSQANILYAKSTHLAIYKNFHRVSPKSVV
ncbi:hypothetical protein UA08_05121 [Talaromyces atroroseus]|uniref:Transcription factor domain-containing protein n=1 Tax=Talaromyces atroroseus TaxID=1441469 RepID=A0A225AQB7_TALAT|nr:hypothetical protein UA08_05121 [Talaromyces atroroseus]OKL59448.1 hypothetical protein UA08_05121 [Talaromyces atroroseus]